ncbi:MAG TPA: ABC transporter permease, partial [Flavipsychrobacter sp.]|nr:ABC transporter permease [Flavipsychrobacter sp.]
IGEGLLWSLAGGLSGIVVGLLLCLGQQQFEWIKMSGFIIDAYPVDIVFTDVLLVIATIVVVGILAAWYPSQKALKTEMSGLKS